MRKTCKVDFNLQLFWLELNKICQWETPNANGLTVRKANQIVLCESIFRKVAIIVRFEIVTANINAFPSETLIIRKYDPWRIFKKHSAIFKK